MIFYNVDRFCSTKQARAGMVGLWLYEIADFERFCSKTKAPAGMVGLFVLSWKTNALREGAQTMRSGRGQGGEVN